MNYEVLKEIVKKELGWVLIDKGDHFITKNEVLYAREYVDGLYLSLSITQDKIAQNVNIHLYKSFITTERQVKALIRKYKKIKKALR